MLEEKDSLWQNLFSDSTADAKANNQDQIKHAKQPKAYYLEELARILFGGVDVELGIDAGLVADFEADPKHYGALGGTHVQG